MTSITTSRQLGATHSRGGGQDSCIVYGDIIQGEITMKLKVKQKENKLTQDPGNASMYNCYP